MVTGATLARRLSAVRAAAISIWIVIIWFTPYDLYAALPISWHQPIGVNAILTGQSWMDNSGTVAALKISALATGVAAILWPRRLRILTPIVFAFVVILDSTTKSVGGYTNHAELVPLYVLGIFALFWRLPFRSPLEPWNTAWERVHNSQYKKCQWLATLAVVLPYTYIGLNRFIEGGVMIFTNDALPSYVRRASLRYSTYGFHSFARLVDVPLVAIALKIGFFVTTLFEASSALVFFHVLYLRAWVVVMVTFHIVTLVSMNIFFWENSILILLLIAFRWRDARPQARGGFATTGGNRNAGRGSRRASIFRPRSFLSWAAGSATSLREVAGASTNRATKTSKAERRPLRG